jgi:hypothetical protein
MPLLHHLNCKVPLSTCVHWLIPLCVSGDFRHGRADRCDWLTDHSVGSDLCCVATGNCASSVTYLRGLMQTFSSCDGRLDALILAAVLL